MFHNDGDVSVCEIEVRRVSTCVDAAGISVDFAGFNKTSFHRPHAERRAAQLRAGGGYRLASR
jgi:hypothetical protein